MKILSLQNKYSAFASIFILAFVTRILILVIYNFDGFYGQDSFAYNDWSQDFYNAIISFHIPPSHYWPIGYFLFTSIFTFFTAGNTGLATLLVSLNAGALTCSVTYLISRELFKNAELQRITYISYFSSIIVCFMTISVKSSVVIMSDSLGLLFASLAVWLILKYLSDLKLTSLMFSMIFLSLAVMTRYANVLIFPLIIYLLLLKKRNIKLSHLGITLLSGVIVFLPQLYYIFKYGIYYFQNSTEMKNWASSWSILNYFKSQFSTVDGTMYYKMPNFLYYLTPVFHPVYLSVSGIFCLAGFYFLVRKKLWYPLIFSLAWILPFYFYLMGIPYQNPRYTLNFLPAIAIVTAYGWDSLIKNKNLKIFTGAIVLIILFAFTVNHFNGFIKQKNSDLEIVSWINNNLSKKDVLFSFEVTNTINHYSNIKPEELFSYNQQKFDSKVDSANSRVYLIIPESKIHGQWKGLPLEKTYDYVRTKYNPVMIGEISYYTIYKVK